LNTDNGYYLSKQWQQRRQQRLDLDSHTCQGCGITAAQLKQLGWPSLQVHHKNAGPPDYSYPSFGHERMSDLLTLCSECHDGITNSVRRQRFKLDPRKRVDAVHVHTFTVNTYYSETTCPTFRLFQSTCRA
jgi:5-methylcytosine-specific restriction endonuclease McrA